MGLEFISHVNYPSKYSKFDYYWPKDQWYIKTGLTRYQDKRESRTLFTFYFKINPFFELVFTLIKK